MSVDPPASGSFPHAPAAPSLVGEVLDGRYKIFKKLGEGGMGEVYAAEHVHIEKRFAVKLLKAEIVSNSEAVKRFQQEARSSSSIKHRNIIAVEDFGRLPDGRIYMCMELLDGHPLNEMIQQEMGADRLLNILIQSGHGLAAAHAKGIVHRDMKPENIFVTQEGNPPNDVPKLLDFGIAKVAGNDGQNNLTRTGTIFGTPFYMAPEQALGNPVDARTDIYAMGVIMYECFTKSLPFQGESFMGILTQHITTPPEPVAQRAAKVGRAIPPGVAEIIMKCMEKDPNQRFQTMDELVNALIAIYRGVAGPGMSTYMEAFPVGSAQHMSQPTPSGMTRAPQTGALPSSTPQPYTPGQSQPYGQGPSQPYAPGQSQPYAPGQSQPYAPGQSQPYAPGQPQGYAPGQSQPYGQQPFVPGQSQPASPYGPTAGHMPLTGSGVYDPAASNVVNVKRGNKGLIIALLVLVAAGGGIAAFVVLGGAKDKDKPSDTTAGAGSAQVATTDTGSGSAGAATPDTPGGSAAAGTDPWAAGSGQAGSAAGSAAAGSAAVEEPKDQGSAAVVPEGPKTVGVLLIANAPVFEVWEDGKKVLDGPDNIQVVPGTPRKLTLKAKGYKDKNITVDGKQSKVTTKLARVPGEKTTTPPKDNKDNKDSSTPKTDCSKTILDPSSTTCRLQFCKTHKNDARCAVLDDE